MLKDIETLRTRLQKKIDQNQEKLDGLMDWCMEKYDVNWYGHQRFEDEYEKRSAKLNRELNQLRYWHKQLYELHLSAVEMGIEDGTHAEMVYLGMIEEGDE